MTEAFAPVALFVFARPDHTKKTLEALAGNILASQTDLIIFSDAALQEKHIQGVQAVRKIIRSATGFRKVIINEREINFGLAKNIIEGVTEVCKKYDRVIVIEDDIVTSRHFLSFMNDGLRTYSNLKKVYSISGYTYPVNISSLAEETFFLRIPLCWGWATWSDRWIKFTKNTDFVSITPKRLIKYINFDGTHDFFSQAIGNSKGRMNTWFIFWYMASARELGLSLFPKISLVKNIGHDGSGDNCESSITYDSEISTNPITVKMTEVVESIYITGQHKKFFKSIRKSFIKKIINKLYRPTGDKL